jgi:hypothetical protein
MKKILQFVLSIVALSSSQLSFAQTYCAPQFSTGCTVGDQIDNFSTTNGLTSNISNLLSGCSPGSYGDFTTMIVDQLPGNSINFTVQSGPSWGQGFRIWVDWNDNGSFTDPGEDVWNSVTSATTPFTGSITVPMGTAPGAKRMRVRANYAGLPTDPCASQSFGEVEDYTFNVIPPGPCSAPPAAGIATTSTTIDCVGNTAFLSLSGNSFGTGQTYQWQSSPNNTTWTDITGATGLNHTATILSGNTYYRCGVTCNSQTSFSTSVMVEGIGSPLSGTYTINQFAAASTTNFVSFSDFADAINCGGVSGPVTVNIVSGTGPYTEQIEFIDFGGTSSTNTVTINGNGNTLTFLSTNTNARHTLKINGSSYMIFDSLNLTAQGATTTEFGWGLWITGNAHHNTFKNATVFVDTGSTSLNFSGIVFSSSPTSATPFSGPKSGSFNTIENNTIIGGYYGLTVISGGTAAQDTGNVIINNTVTDFRLYGMYFNGQHNLEVIGNNVTRGNRFITGFASFYGLYFTNRFTDAKIVGNRVYSSCSNCSNNTGSIFTTYFSGASGLIGQENLFANNMFYDLTGDGSAYGIYSFTNDFWKFYHNHFVMDDPNASPTTVEAVYHSGLTPNTEYKNNILSVDRSGTNVRGFNFITANNGVISDYNAIYVPNGNVGRSGTVDFNTLAAWQAGINQDLNSTEAPPIFVDPANLDYTPGTPAYSGAGTNLLSDVPTDINNVARTATPDLGAIEFVPLPCAGPFNFGMDSVTNNSTFITWGSFETNWVVEWGAVGFIPGSGAGTIVPTSNNNMYELTGLSPDSCFDVWVAEVCGPGDTSTWTGPITVCTPIEYDSELLSLIRPTDLSCGDSALPITIEIRNNGFFPISSMPITANISGDLNQTLNFTYTGNLQINQVDTVVIGTVNLYNGGYLNVEVFTALTNDQNLSNDSLSADSLLVVPFQPLITNAEYCPGATDVTIRTLPLLSGGYQWFDVATGGTPIATGDSIVVPTTSGTLYVGYLDNQDSLNTIQQGGSGCGAGNMFDVIPNSTLDITGFTVRPFATQANMPISVYIVTGGYQGTTQASWTLVESGVLANAVNGQPTRFNLTNPLTINANTTYGIYLQFNASYTVGANTYSNSDLTLIAGLGLCSPFDYCCNPRTWNGAIHYGVSACSDIRTPVTPTATDSVIANFNWTTISHTVSFVSTSQNADSVVWDFAGLGSASGDSVSFQFPQTDSFQVCLIAYNSCGTDTICQMVWAENISVEQFAQQMQLDIFPNPNNGRFTLSFVQDYIGDVTIDLLDLSGKLISREHHPKFNGKYHRDLERVNLAGGSYLLRISTANGVTTRRVVINK